MKAITDYWFKFYNNYNTELGKWGLCSLCGNTGKIDTTGRAISPTGIDAGRVNFCICPNGQALRKADTKLTLRIIKS